MLTFKSVTFAYEPVNPILRDASFRFAQPDHRVLGLMGMSGTGKSTVLKLAAGLVRPQRGEVLVETEHVGYLAQHPTFLPRSTVIENARIGERVRATASRFCDDLFWRVAELLGVSSILDARAPEDLSGGEARRVALLRCLSVQPRLLLLDEPTTGLDAQRRAGLLALLSQLASSLDFVVVFSTHHVDDLLQAADGLIYLEAHGSSTQVVAQALDKALHAPASEAVARCLLGPGARRVYPEWPGGALPSGSVVPDLRVSLQTRQIEELDAPSARYYRPSASGTGLEVAQTSIEEPGPSASDKR